jgi:DNA-directed RNA polymerase subunit H
VERMKKIDPTHHELVPKHIILSDGEVEDLLKVYNITKDKLPLIKVADPVVIAIGAKPGQVIKIVREDSPAGEAFTYRLVIK